MKRLIFLICILIPACGHAQEKRTVKETFDNNLFRWDEFYEMEYSGNIEEGYYVLNGKKDGFVHSVTELPIFNDRNFKITYKFLIPKLTDKYFFGLIFNYEDDSNYDSFCLTEKRFKFAYMKEGVMRDSRKGDLILNAGKNKEVEVIMEHKGSRLIFTVDNMEVITITRAVKYNTFGFFVQNSNTLKVDEISIEQIDRE